MVLDVLLAVVAFELVVAGDPSLSIFMLHFHGIILEAVSLGAARAWGSGSVLPNAYGGVLDAASSCAACPFVPWDPSPPIWPALGSTFHVFAMFSPSHFA